MKGRSQRIESRKLLRPPLLHFDGNSKGTFRFAIPPAEGILMTYSLTLKSNASVTSPTPAASRAA